MSQLAYDNRVNRPVLAPPDPIAFQQQKALFSEEEKEIQIKLKNALEGPSLFGREITI